MTFKETELMLDFPDPVVNEQIVSKTEQESNQSSSDNFRTNIASNRAIENNHKSLDADLQRELDQARSLVKDVSHQLSKDIPTVDDLQMPVKKYEGALPDSLLNKQYSGESNVEYFLKNRHHLLLPIPVYLSQYGGTVRVNIEVDLNGNVLEASPEIKPNVQEQLLSYAKTAALRTKFNTATNGDKRQKGYIIYHFIAQ